MAYCFDEVVDTFGVFVESELDSLKKGKKEKDENFNARKQRYFLKLIGKKEAIKYASPVATTAPKKS